MFLLQSWKPWDENDRATRWKGPGSVRLCSCLYCCSEERHLRRYTRLEQKKNSPLPCCAWAFGSCLQLPLHLSLAVSFSISFPTVTNTSLLLPLSKGPTLFTLLVPYLSPIPALYVLLLAFYFDSYAAFNLPQSLVFPDTYHFPSSDSSVSFTFLSWWTIILWRNKYRPVSLETWVKD